MGTGPIVVPLDGSKNAEAAIPFALRLASLYQADLRFVHVVHGEQLRKEGDLATASETFRSYVDGLVAARTDGKVRYETRVLAGAPAAEVLAAAEDASYIAIATHGRGGIKAAFVGSVADKVVRGARLPVFLVPLAAGSVAPGSGPVLIALDGSYESEAALRIGRELATRLGAKVTLLRAYSLPPAVGVEFAPYPADLLTTLEQDAEDYLRKIAHEGESALCVQGSAAEGIAQAADEAHAGLVVVAAHGRGFAGRIALGSTTDRLMHMLKHPMLIAPMERAEEAG